MVVDPLTVVVAIVVVPEKVLFPVKILFAATKAGVVVATILPLESTARKELVSPVGKRLDDNTVPVAFVKNSCPEVKAVAEAFTNVCCKAYEFAVEVLKNVEITVPTTLIG